MSKKLSIIGLILMLMVSSLSADSINEQIEAIQGASPQERVERMNRLKLQIASMNEEERTQALETLRGSKNNSGQRMQNRLHQGSMGEGNGAMQQLRIRSHEITHPRQQGR